MKTYRENIKSIYCDNKGLSFNYDYEGGRCSGDTKCDSEDDKRI